MGRQSGKKDPYCSGEMNAKDLMPPISTEKLVEHFGGESMAGTPSGTPNVSKIVEGFDPTKVMDVCTPGGGCGDLNEYLERRGLVEEAGSSGVEPVQAGGGRRRKHRRTHRNRNRKQHRRLKNHRRTTRRRRH